MRNMSLNTCLAERVLSSIILVAKRKGSSKYIYIASMADTI